MNRLATMLIVLALSSPAFAGQDQQPAPEPEKPVEVFGFALPEDARLKIGAVVIAGWSHDGMQAQLGFEKQGRLAQATLTFSGRLTDRIGYFVSVNPVNETSSKPACGEEHFFFPNDPSFYTAGPRVPCDPENGHKRVDTYNTYGLDYITQQGPLREGYVDFRPTSNFSTRFGRFIVPIGFAPLEVGSWTAKDLTRIQRLNAEANFGAMLAWSQRRASGERLFDIAVMGVLGEGNREKDYDWFYFADTSLDTNSALTAIGSARVTPHKAVDLRVAYKKGFTGSKVERLPSYWASKRNDEALVVSAKVDPLPWISLFGEYARYVWGPTDTSAAMLDFDPEPIVKPGAYFGARVAVPVTSRLKAGVTVTREEISRDDSLIKYLDFYNLYGVEMGKKDRGTIARFFVEISNLVTVGAFWADISNPYPWASGAWPVSGPRAYTGRDPGRYGISVVLKTP